jgi:hypothetical protein
MANHIRQQLREDAETTVTGLTTTGTNVFSGRSYPLEESKLPCLLVFTKSETSEYISLTSPRRKERTVDLVIMGVAKAASGLDDTLDLISKEVEEAIEADVTLGGTAKDLELVTTEIALEDGGSQPLGTIELTFQVIYNTAEADSDAAI